LQARECAENEIYRGRKSNTITNHSKVGKPVGQVSVPKIIL